MLSSQLTFRVRDGCVIAAAASGAARAARATRENRIDTLYTTDMLPVPILPGYRSRRKLSDGGACLGREELARVLEHEHAPGAARVLVLAALVEKEAADAESRGGGAHRSLHLCDLGALFERAKGVAVTLLEALVLKRRKLNARRGVASHQRRDLLVVPRDRHRTDEFRQSDEVRLAAFTLVRKRRAGPRSSL